MKGSLKLPGWETTAGEKSRTAKLTDDQVRTIRNEIGRPEDLAIKYGVSAAYIQCLKARRKRGDVK